MIQLFGTDTSPYVRHCRIALAQEAIPFEMVSSNLEQSAHDSPTKKVPYLKVRSGFLTDSCSILHYIRKERGKIFLSTTREANLFFLANTTLDTAINVFLLEKDGITEGPYLERQRSRIQSCFEALEREMSAWQDLMDDGFIRVGCLLGWVRFRQRFDFSSYYRLGRFENHCDQDFTFSESAPPPPDQLNPTPK